MAGLVAVAVMTWIADTISAVFSKVVSALAIDSAQGSC
jgi:hypothetical protein